ncbi:MAG: hypothetical protein WBA89_08485 [Microcoleus sp.]
MRCDRDEEGRRKKEEIRNKKEEGRRPFGFAQGEKKEEGKRKKEGRMFELSTSPPQCPMPDARCPMPDARCPMPDLKFSTRQEESRTLTVLR